MSNTYIPYIIYVSQTEILSTLIQLYTIKMVEYFFRTVHSDHLSLMNWKLHTVRKKAQ